MAMLRTAPTLALLACLAPGPQMGEASAQVIRGVVVDSANQLPITGVLVLLSDSANREVQRRQVDTNGEFGFVGLGPGRYSVRAERWGMTTDTVERIDVAPGDTVSLRMALAQLSVARLVEEVGRIVDLRARRPPPEGIDRARETDWIAYTEDGGFVVGQVQDAGEAVMESGGRVGLVRVGLADEKPVVKITLRLPRVPAGGGW